MKRAKICMILVCCALLRCLAEPYRLYHTNPSLSFSDIQPFITGAAICSVALFISMGLFFYKRFGYIAIVCIMAIAGLLAIKLLVMH